MTERLVDSIVAGKRPVKQKKNRNRDNNNALLAISPLLLLILAVTVYPSANAIYHSFTVWDGLNSKFTGLSNYGEIFADPQFWRLMLNNLVYILSVPLQIVIALVITVLLYEKIAGWKFFRALYFLPNVLSAIVIALVFKQLFMYDGPVNAFLRLIKLDFLAIDWLSNGPSALLVIVLAVVWSNFGYGVIILLAGMSTIEPSVFEAALMDGATWFQKVFYIVLPMLSRVIEFFSVITIIWTFTGLFGFIFGITAGGPGYDTTPLEYMIYIKAFRIGNEMGGACALAVILLLITFLISRLQMYITEKTNEGME